EEPQIADNLLVSKVTHCQQVKLGQGDAKSAIIVGSGAGKDRDMAISAANSFGTRDQLNVGAQSFEIHRLERLGKKVSSENTAKLPFSLRILLENLLRNEDGRFVHAQDIETLASWKPGCAEKE